MLWILSINQIHNSQYKHDINMISLFIPIIYNRGSQEATPTANEISEVIGQQWCR